MRYLTKIVLGFIFITFPCSKGTGQEISALLPPEESANSDSSLSLNHFAQNENISPASKRKHEPDAFSDHNAYKFLNLGGIKNDVAVDDQTNVVIEPVAEQFYGSPPYSFNYLPKNFWEKIQYYLSDEEALVLRQISQNYKKEVHPIFEKFKKSFLEKWHYFDCTREDTQKRIIQYAVSAEGLQGNIRIELNDFSTTKSTYHPYPFLNNTAALDVLKWGPIKGIRFTQTRRALSKADFDVLGKKPLKKPSLFKNLTDLGFALKDGKKDNTALIINFICSYAPQLGSLTLDNAAFFVSFLDKIKESKTPINLKRLGFFTRFFTQDFDYQHIKQLIAEYMPMVQTDIIMENKTLQPIDLDGLNRAKKAEGSIFSVNKIFVFYQITPTLENPHFSYQIAGSTHVFSPVNLKTQDPINLPDLFNKKLFLKQNKNVLESFRSVAPNLKKIVATYSLLGSRDGTQLPISQWRHVYTLDPNKQINADKGRKITKMLTLRSSK